MDAQGGKLLTVRGAADALGVSVETVRRWTEAGRLKAERTSGGHRRFSPAEIQRLLGSEHVALRPIAPPAEPLPLLSELFDGEGPHLIEAAAKRLYTGQRSGWFATAGAQEPLRDWLAALAGSARSGLWPAAIEATRGAFGLARIQGASLLERHGFLEIFGALAVRGLSAAGPPPAELAGTRRLFNALRQRLLYEHDSLATAAHSGLSASSDGLSGPLAELLMLPDLEWAAVYEADSDALELRLRAHAAPQEATLPIARSYSFGTGAVGKVALARRATVERGGTSGVVPLALAPMSTNGELAGVLVLGLRRARPVGEHELRLLEALAGALARSRSAGPAGAEAMTRALAAFRAAWAAPSMFSRAG